MTPPRVRRIHTQVGDCFITQSLKAYMIKGQIPIRNQSPERQLKISRLCWRKTLSSGLPVSAVTWTLHPDFGCRPINAVPRNPCTWPPLLLTRPFSRHTLFTKSVQNLVDLKLYLQSLASANGRRRSCVRRRVLALASQKYLRSRCH